MESGTNRGIPASVVSLSIQIIFVFVNQQIYSLESDESELQFACEIETLKSLILFLYLRSNITTKRTDLELQKEVILAFKGIKSNCNQMGLLVIGQFKRSKGTFAPRLVL
ncbi:hypothetical protein HHK36_023286 [Tetracentron sinense]|uniref:Uncharacterized protein n=1 Tax=Tetracentron sinense TaxID=13715 RepID=A0A834YQ50_TETSI|nr:hypothetical protein HHK36_023286 [Tetracentron sinense]